MNQKTSELEAMRRELKQCLELDEPVLIGDLEKVNTFSRIERMMQETRILLAALVEPSNELHALIDVYEHLAVDWVYGGELDWNDSMAAKQALKIVELNRKPAVYA